MYFSVAQEVRLHTSALLSHRPGKETNPSSVVLSISPHQRSPPPPKTRKPLGNRIHHLTRLRGRATGGRQGEAHRLPCVRTSPSPRNSSASGAGGREKGEARGGRAAHHRRHKPRGDLTKEGGVGGNGAAAAAQRTPRRRPELSGGTKAPAPLPPARSPRGRAAVGGRGGGGTAAGTKPAGRRAGTPATSRREGPGSLERSGTCAAEGWGARGGSPPLPAPAPSQKGSGAAPRTRREALPRGGPLCAPPPPHTHPHTPPPRYRGEQRSHLLARPLLFHRGPAEIARERDAEREADGEPGPGLRGWLPGGGGRRWCPQDGAAATTPPRRGPSPDRLGAPAPPAPRARPAAPPANGRERSAWRVDAPAPPPPPRVLERRGGAREGAAAAAARGAAWRAAPAAPRPPSARRPAVGGARQLRLTEGLEPRVGGAGPPPTPPRAGRPRGRRRAVAPAVAV